HALRPPVTRKRQKPLGPSRSFEVDGCTAAGLTVPGLGNRNEVHDGTRQTWPQAGCKTKESPQARQRLLRHQVEGLPHGATGGRQGAWLRLRRSSQEEAQLP